MEINCNKDNDKNLINTFKKLTQYNIIRYKLFQKAEKKTKIDFKNTVSQNSNYYTINNNPNYGIRSRYKKLLNSNNKKNTEIIKLSKATNYLPIKVNKKENLNNKQIVLNNNIEKEEKKEKDKVKKINIQKNIYQRIKLEKQEIKKININYGMNYKTRNKHLIKGERSHSSLEIQDRFKFGIKSEEKNNINENMNILYKNLSIPVINLYDYKIIKSIGEGTYGTIFEVSRKINNQKFAMKKVLFKNINILKNVLNSLELSFSLKHENILKIYGIYIKYLNIEKYLLYILMELAETDWNLSIIQRSRQKLYYSENELNIILSQLTSALYYLQKNNIVHRDIKPENILIFKTKEGKNIYKICDFGEAKKINDISLEKSHSLRGTNIYMSPLLYRSFKDKIKQVEHNVFKSDVFSLGYCLIYSSEMNFCTIKKIRELKFQGLINQLLKKMMKGRYSDKFIELIIKMIQIDENKRIDFIQLSNIINTK